MGTYQSGVMGFSSETWIPKILMRKHVDFINPAKINMQMNKINSLANILGVDVDCVVNKPFFIDPVKILAR